MKKYLSYIYVILSAVCWGFIGFSNRMLTEVGVSLGNRVFIRNFGTLVILTIVFALFHRQVFRIKLKHLPIFLCSGLLSILTLSLVYFQCQTMCSLSVAAVLLYLAPSFVVIFSAVLWKTPLTKRKLIALVVSLLGCVMVSGIIGGDGGQELVKLVIVAKLQQVALAHGLKQLNAGDGSAPTAVVGLEPAHVAIGQTAAEHRAHNLTAVVGALVTHHLVARGAVLISVRKVAVEAALELALAGSFLVLGNGGSG